MTLQKRDDLVEHFVDRLVELWHNDKGEPDQSLHDFMGLTFDGYGALIACRYDDVLPPNLDAAGLDWGREGPPLGDQSTGIGPSAIEEGAR